jgi:hypothetical protein
VVLSDGVLSSVNSLLIMSQAAQAGRQNYLIEEFQDVMQGLQADEAQAEQGVVADDIQILQAKPDGFPRRRHKAVVPLDTSLLRPSARLEKIQQGFNPNNNSTKGSGSASSSALPPSKAKNPKNKGKIVIHDGPAYAGSSVPGAPSSPRLSLENAQSIGTGFCKMLPGAVSGAVLQAPDNEDVDN